MKKVKGLSKTNKQTKKPLIDNSMANTKRKWGETGESKGGINSDGKRHDFTIQYINDIL